MSSFIAHIARASFAFVALCCLVGCVPDEREAPRRGASVIVPERSVLDTQEAFQRVADLARPSVVNIRSRRFVQPVGPRFGPFGEMPDGQPQLAVGTGSGFIVRSDGWILTNDHVVAGADRVTVRLSDGREFDGQVSRDFRSDLAAIKIDSEGLPTLELFADEVSVGAWAIAYGAPFGLEETMTVGVVSATGRASLIGADSGQARFFPDLLQTDASINPGNSGGPLLDISGRVIGVNVAIGSPTGGNVGIGFAIPAYTARFVMKELIERGVVTRGYLGLLPANLSPTDQERYGVEGGALVMSMTDGSPADRAGIQVEDIIVAFNGRPIEGDVQLREAIARAEPGRTVRITLVREGRQMQVTARVADAPTPPEPPEAERQPAGPPAGRLGVQIVELTAELARRLGIRPDVEGVIVAEVQPGGAAAEAGIRPADIIVRVAGQPVRSPDDLQTALAKVASSGQVTLVVRRGSVQILMHTRVL